ncbi:MAG: response regulator [Chloroflexi bacterium]|nr:response regulator [Chloroflexota bacterium]
MPEPAPASTGAADIDVLDQLVRDALAHLFDPAALEHHELGRVLLPGTHLSAGALRQLLLTAIERLHPPALAPSGSPAWRHYQALHLRYINGLSPAEVASTLALSERQARREHHEAISALVALLLESPSPSPPAHAGRLEAINEDAPPPCDLGLLLEGVATTVQPLLAQRGAELVAEPFPHGTAVCCSRVLLRQSLLALIIEASNRGCCHFRLAASSAGADVTITLAITGAGEVASPTFSPPLDPAVILTRRRTESGGVWQITVPRAHPLVLLVDDDPDFARLFQRCLTNAPYRTVAASTPEAALRLATTERPQCIVLDVLLPSFDGWELLQQLQSSGDTARIPVVICSALADPALASALGAAACLPKPVSPRSLLTTVAKACGVSWATAPAPPNSSSSRRSDRTSG